MKPTAQYQKFDIVYEHFNKELFDSKLPGAFILFTRKSLIAGHFGVKRFEGKKTKEIADEISLNPDFFFNEKMVLQTLVHEMCHQWQHHHGKPSRSAYHNIQWSKKMESIGLMPSHTGKPGGKRVGQQMDDYIIDSGKFQKIIEDLIKEENIIDWISITAESRLMVRLEEIDNNILRIDSKIEGLREGTKITTGNSTFVTESIEDDGRVKVRCIRGDGEIKKNEEAIVITSRNNKKNKVRYSCSKCGLNVWGKPDIRVACFDCKELMYEAF